MFAVLVYLPGLALETDYLALAASLITFLFTVLEVRAGRPHTDIENSEILSVVYFIVHLQQLLRYFRMWPGGEGLHASLLPLLDSQDSGPLLLSHLYLLLGISLPLWVTPLRQYGHGELQVYTADLYTLVYHQHLIMYSSTYIHTYIHTCTYIHTYMHTCIHTYNIDLVYNSACVDVSLTVGKLALYSGVLALGVGDSMAAIAGTLMGKTKWPGE